MLFRKAQPQKIEQDNRDKRSVENAHHLAIAKSVPPIIFSSAAREEEAKRYIHHYKHAAELLRERVVLQSMGTSHELEQQFRSQYLTNLDLAASWKGRALGSASARDWGNDILHAAARLLWRNDQRGFERFLGDLLPRALKTE